MFYYIIRPVSGRFRAGVSARSMVPARFRPFSGWSVGGIYDSGPYQAISGPECRWGLCFRPISGRFRAGVPAGSMLPAHIRPFPGRSAGGAYASGPFHTVSGPECRRGLWFRPVSGHFRAGVLAQSMLPAHFRPFPGRSGPFLGGMFAGHWKAG